MTKFRQNAGRIVLEKGQVIDLPNNRLYPTKVALSHRLEIQLSYQITKKWSVLGNLSRESYFTNWLSKDAPFQQQPKIFSSSLGVAWSF